MKKTIVLAMMALAIVALPATAQSRKDKKAAKKAEWEMQQQQKAEEAALLHQMKMDSIRAVQEAREAAKADAERKKTAREAEEAYQLSMQTNTLPCFEADTKEYFTGFAYRVMPMSYVTTQSIAVLRLAKQQLQQKIKGAYKQVVRDYFDQMDIDDKFSATSHIESAGEMVIDEFVNNTETQCTEMTRPDAAGKVHYYVGVRVSKEEIVREIVEKIPEEVKKDVRLNEAEFRNEVFKVFENTNE